jgi:hypothetical protein
MTTNKTLFVILLIHLSTALLGYPCKKYIVKGGAKVAPGEITIVWGINTSHNNCGFDKGEVFKHQFIVTIKDMFGQVLVKDTTEQNVFRINAQLVNNGPMIVSIEELEDAEQHYTVVIKVQQDGLFSMQSEIDSLNTYLLNGYFMNAFSILLDMNRVDLIDAILAQYDILFPGHYSDEERFLNCYLDPETFELIRMPLVEGLPSFIKAVNRLERNEPKRPNGFRVFATITSEGKPAHYTVIPGSDKVTFDKFSHLLSFNNQRGKEGEVMIIFGRSRNQRQFTVINQRALMDPESKAFKTKYPYRGSVH